MMGANDRVQITAQLVPGQDDDLIRWLLTVPQKGRNRAIKNLLRRGLGLPEDEGDTRPVIAIHQDGGHDELVELREMVNRLLARIDDNENYLEQRLAGYNPHPTETVQVVSNQDYEKRKRNLKKAAW